MCSAWGRGPVALVGRSSSSIDPANHKSGRPQPCSRSSVCRSTIAPRWLRARFAACCCVAAPACLPRQDQRGATPPHRAPAPQPPPTPDPTAAATPSAPATPSNAAGHGGGPGLWPPSLKQTAAASAAGGMIPPLAPSSSLPTARPPASRQHMHDDPSARQLTCVVQGMVALELSWGWRWWGHGSSRSRSNRIDRPACLCASSFSRGEEAFRLITERSEPPSRPKATSETTARARAVEQAWAGLFHPNSSHTHACLPPPRGLRTAPRRFPRPPHGRASSISQRNRSSKRPKGTREGRHGPKGALSTDVCEPRPLV